MIEPGPANRYQVEHAERLRPSFHARTGRDLIDPALAPEAVAATLFHAPFVVLSPDAAPDPLLTYGHRPALERFELTWEALIQMPSRLTVETPDRAERARRLAEVAARGYIDNDAGVRIARTGRRFQIRRATVWNLTDDQDRFCGQAALVREWRALADAGRRRR